MAVQPAAPTLASIYHGQVSHCAVSFLIFVTTITKLKWLSGTNFLFLWVFYTSKLFIHE